jgi:hypothetical protein
MLKFRQFFEAKEYDPHPAPMWHGSPSGNLRGGTSGLHLGTRQAAHEALTARIGHPAEGHWDGTREYGKTKLAGQVTMKKQNIPVTGHNCKAPQHDYLPHEHPEGLPKHGNGERMDPANKPAIKKYQIIGKMSNTIHSPHKDFNANGYMKAALKKGNAKRGHYYANQGEDAGSISAVVPNGNHVKEIP